MRLLSSILPNRCCHGSAWVFAAAFGWKVLLFLASAQPIPANDSFFYDGAVVNLLLHGHYINPALSLALPISGTQVFSAYPPLYQLVLYVWMRVWGTSALAAMGLHLVLFGGYLLVALAILRRLGTPSWCIHCAGAFLFSLTFHDRPDSLAHILGMLAVYSWIRSRPSLNTNPTQLVAQASVPPYHPGAATIPCPPDGRWAWAATALLVLGLCTSLQIGAVYLLVVWLGMVACRILAHDIVPVYPIALSVLVPAMLVVLVIAAWPQLWAGFLEHARQTPSLTGWRRPHLDEFLKVCRAVPATLVIAASLPWLAVMDPRRDQDKNLKFSVVAVVLTLPTLGLVLGCLTVVTPNMVGIAGYLQPLCVAAFLAHTSSRLAPSLNRAQLQIFLGLALLASIRALGMTTWGLACAADCGYPTAMSRIKSELAEAQPGATVGVSAAYLYQAAHRADLRWVHSDWLHPADRGRPNADAEALVALKPRKLLLTQFDYHRRYEEIVNSLKRQPRLVRVQIIDTARVRPPDASHLWQRVVQHICWAPVVITFEWQ